MSRFLLCDKDGKAVDAIELPEGLTPYAADENAGIGWQRGEDGTFTNPNAPKPTPDLDENGKEITL